MKKVAYLYFTLICVMTSCNVKSPENSGKEPVIRHEYSPLITQDVPESFNSSVESDAFYDDEVYFSGENDSYHKPDISNTIGVVVARISDRSSEVVFLNDDGSTYLTISFFDDDFYNDEELRANSYSLISPRLYEYSYDLLIMDCVAEYEDSFEVIIKHSPRQTKRVLKTDWLVFETWEEHIQKVIIGLTSKTEVKDGPDGNDLPDEAAEQIREIEVLNVSEISGDWIKVYDAFDYTDLTGWVQWRDGNTLLVGLYYML